MHKTKARDLLICWPFPKSTTSNTPDAEYRETWFGWMQFCHKVNTGSKWSEVDQQKYLDDIEQDRQYHEQQAAMVKAIRYDDQGMAMIRLACQLKTRQRREQFVLLRPVDSSASSIELPVVGTHLAYPPGSSMIHYGLCGIGAPSLMSCMFCPFGHVTECHFPNNCQEAKCSHLTDFAMQHMQPAGSKVQ